MFIVLFADTEIIIDCGPPKAPLDGTVTLLDVGNTTLHAVAEYKCDQDHFLIFGEAMTICQGNGTWSGGERICIYSKALEPCMCLCETLRATCFRKINASLFLIMYIHGKSLVLHFLPLKLSHLLMLFRCVL